MASSNARPSSESSITPETIGFEASLKAVERAVAALESGQLDLDAALSAYETGIQMLTKCHTLLDTAERRVSLIQRGDNEDDLIPTPFEATQNTE